MKPEGIRIKDDNLNSAVLEISPKDIFKYIYDGHRLYWAILEIEATGDLGKNEWDKLHQCETSDKKMMRISWDKLKEISNDFQQVIWFTAIGCKELSNLKFYKEDMEMYECCEISVQIIDGQYCEVFSKDHNLIKRLEKHFKNTEVLTPKEQQPPYKK